MWRSFKAVLLDLRTITRRRRELGIPPSVFLLVVRHDWLASGSPRSAVADGLPFADTERVRVAMMFSADCSCEFPEAVCWPPACEHGSLL